MGRDRRKGGVLALALMVGAALWLWLRPGRAPVAPPVAPPVAVAEIDAPVASSPLPPTVQSEKTAAAVSGEDDEPAPVIDEIVVEKPEVCEGEENLIRVKAHTINGTDAFLRASVDGEQGSSVVVRSYLEDGGRQPTHVVQVFGRNKAHASVHKPLFKVKSCAPPVVVTIDHFLQPNTRRAFQLVARASVPSAAVGAGAPREWKPVRYEWDFGDGATLTTSTPVADHDYRDYVEQSITSEFLVKVEVFNADGKKYSGRQTLSLYNPVFANLAIKKQVSIQARMLPSSPVLDSDGKVRQRVTLFHQRPDDVLIHSVTRVRQTDEGPASEVRARSEILDPQQVLRTSRIGPGLAGISFDVEMMAGNDPNFVMERYVVEGSTRDGTPASGHFSVMKPPPAPTRDDEPIEDPALIARILAAQRILGKEIVNDMDLARLEREGRFAGLQVDPALADSGRQKAAERQVASPKRHPPVETRSFAN
jgi:hypothetical protein